MFKIVHIPTLLEVKDATKSIYRYNIDAIISFEDWIDSSDNVYGTIYFRTRSAANKYIRDSKMYKLITDTEEPSIELYKEDEGYFGDSLRFKKKEFMVEEV